MAKEYQTSIYAHPSIYEPTERKMNLYFSEPEQGVNTETGIVLLIPGFGGNASSNVYKKMRNQFADQYNLITVQCDYFGWQFMQSDRFDKVHPLFNVNDLKSIFTQEDFSSVYLNGTLHIPRLLQVGSNYNVRLDFRADLGETLSEFNDMGIMQAIDNITAVLAVMAILDDNKLEYNKEKISIYGHSQGAYLAYLCNAFAPNLFSCILDNSAWLYPAYLRPESNRCIFYQQGKAKYSIEINYLAKTILNDQEILSLPLLYKQFENHCKIISFHGSSDNFHVPAEKENFCKLVKHCNFNLISEKEVEGEIFKSTNHGLDADFLKLFGLVYEQYGIDSNAKELLLPKVSYKTEKYEYEVTYDTGMPAVILRR